MLDTASGRQLDLTAPAVESIDLGDIAGALSRICRFGAQSKAFYSVAQHAVMVHDLVVAEGRGDLALAALRHDSHEAYVCDVPTPVKQLLKMTDGRSGYGQLCNRLDETIANALRFAVPDEESGAIIKRADRQALLAEAAVLVADGGSGIRRAFTEGRVDLESLEPVPKLDVPLEPRAAENAFLAAHRRSADFALASDV